MKLDFSRDRSNGFCDELIAANGLPGQSANKLIDCLLQMDAVELNQRLAAVDTAIMTLGITLTIDNDGSNIDRAWPFDIIPRVMPSKKWQRIKSVLK